MDNDDWRRFQSLIGKLKTCFLQHFKWRHSQFQSLIGKLKTLPATGGEVVILDGT